MLTLFRDSKSEWVSRDVSVRLSVAERQILYKEKVFYPRMNPDKKSTEFFCCLSFYWLVLNYDLFYTQK